MPSKLTRTTTDHGEIRRWAEERNAEPAEVERTERDGETGMIRLDFPGYAGAGSLKHISWDEWFQKFDESGLALVYQDRTARGQRSNFNKLIGRETADARAHGENKASRRSLRGRGGRSTGRRSSGGDRRTATSARAGARRGAGSRRSSTRTSRTVARDTGRTQRSGGARAGRAPAATREAPRAIAARLTGRGHMGDRAGTRRSASSRGTSRKGSSGRGKSAARSAAKGGARTTKRTGRSSRRSRR